MNLNVGLIIEGSLGADYQAAAVESVLRLWDTMEVATEPIISVQQVGNMAFPTNRKGQVDRTVIDTLPADRGLTIAATARDLGAGDAETAQRNFVYGYSRLGRLIVSTRRLRSDRQFAALTLHEAGHAKGLVQPTARNLDRASGFGGHCANQCVMQPGSEYADLLALVRQSESDRPFCNDCSSFLVQRAMIA